LDIQLTCRHCELPLDVREYASKKIDHVLKHFDGVHSVEMVFAAEGLATKVEMIVSTVRSHRLVATASAPEAKAAVDLVADKMDRQIKKEKEKLRDQR
jgi:putative sigma-54 modulation protein